MTYRIKRIKSSTPFQDASYSVLNSKTGELEHFIVVPDTRPYLVRLFLHIILWPFRWKKRRQIKQAQAEVRASIEAVKQSMLDTCRMAVKIVESLQPYSMHNHSPHPFTQPAMRYQTAQSPYGNHTRGKKRWLREMKREAR